MIRGPRSLPERIPLRVTLVASLLLLVTMALGVSGAAGTYVLRGYLIDGVDVQLQDAKQYALDVYNASKLRPYSDGGNAQSRLPNPMGWSSLYIAFVDNDGSGLAVQFTHEGTKQNPPKLPSVDRAAVAKRDGKVFAARPVDGRGHNWRVVAVPLPDGVGSAIVALSLGGVDETVGKLAAAQIVIGAIVLAVLAVIGYAMVRTSLRRLVQVERTAQAIADGDLTQRVPPGHPDTEVGRLSAAFNAMVEKIESAFRARETSEAEARASEARMRRFAADASHELRTPLTAIRGFAELYRQGGGDAAHVIGRIEHHATRMGLLVEDLLLLARLDQQRPLDRAPVDLLALAADAVHDAAATAEDHPVRLDARAPEPPVVLGDEPRLRQVIGNLLSNAVQHTPSGTPVTVTVDVRDGAAVLEVADAGPGLVPEDAARVFERFFRTDPARSRTDPARVAPGAAVPPGGAAGGSGLGLSIVDALVSAHGGTVLLWTGPGEGARFEVRLPLYQPVEAADPEVGGGFGPAAGSDTGPDILTGGPPVTDAEQTVVEPAAS
jgi:two-component system OmpR family sensor kinase